VRDSNDVQARLGTWSEQLLTRAAIEQWEVVAAKRSMSNGGAPGEDGVSPAMINAAGKPMEETQYLMCAGQKASCLNGGGKRGCECYTKWERKVM
jgi:hypothetical protein